MGNFAIYGLPMVPGCAAHRDGFGCADDQSYESNKTLNTGPHAIVRRHFVGTQNAARTCLGWGYYKAVVFGCEVVLETDSIQAGLAFSRLHRS
jgi:hypothetical protein